MGNKKSWGESVASQNHWLEFKRLLLRGVKLLLSQLAVLPPSFFRNSTSLLPHLAGEEQEHKETPVQPLASNLSLYEYEVPLAQLCTQIYIKKSEYVKNLSSLWVARWVSSHKDLTDTGVADTIMLIHHLCCELMRIKDLNLFLACDNLELWLQEGYSPVTSDFFFKECTLVLNIFLQLLFFLREEKSHNQNDLQVS